MEVIEKINGKHCTKCNELKHFDNFYEKKGGKFGYHSWCKSCCVDYRKNYRNGGREKIEQRRKKDLKNKKKTCSNCNQYKSFDKFSPKKAGKYGLKSQCKDCYNKKQRLYRKRKTLDRKLKREVKINKNLKNKEKECTNCGEIKKFDQFHKSNKGRYKLSSWCKSCDKNYRLNKPTRKRTKYRRERRRNNLEVRIKDALRGRIYKALKGYIKSKSTEELLGLSIDEFKNYLEKQFQDGMSWDNYGEWHIDHIIPCASYNLLKPHHQEECFFYTNMQPLWAEDNWKKNDKLNW